MWCPKNTDKIAFRVISTFLIYALIVPNVTFAAPGPAIDTLAVQSSFKPMVAKIAAKNGKLDIVDDEQLLQEATKGFKKDAEFMYLEALQDEAAKARLSSAKTKDLIKKHLSKIEFSGDFDKGTRDAFLIKKQIHTYSEVKNKKKKGEIIQELYEEATGNGRAYLRRFVKGYAAGSGRHLLHLELMSTEDIDKAPYCEKPSERKVFGEGLLMDEDKGFWIVKKFEENAAIPGVEERKKKNFPRREMRGSLLARGRSNSVDIRFLTREEVSDVAMFRDKMDKLDQYYLTRVATGSNIKKETLPDRDPSRAYSSIFVSNMFMRMWDPHWQNVGFVDGIPVVFDLDETNRYDMFPNDRDGFKKFLAQYLIHALFYTAMDMADGRGGKNNASLQKDWEMIDFCDKKMGDKAYIVQLSTMENILEHFGLADGFIAAEMLDANYMRQAILRFKGIKNVRELIAPAGGEEEEIEAVVSFIWENQNNLGKDVNEALKFITGKDYGFDKIDEEYKIMTEPEMGRKFIDSLLWRAREAKKLGQDIIIGLETSWIPREQFDAANMQELINELVRLTREEGLDNVIIRRGEGTELAGELKGALDETGASNSNVIILGDHDILEHEAFDCFRKGLDPEKWAFFAGVELPEDFPGNNYIRLFEMIAISINLAFGEAMLLDNPFIQIVREGRRIFKFIPKVEPMDYNLLQEIYSKQVEAMKYA